MLLCALRDAAQGEAFLVSGGERVTWREFYAAFERMLGRSATVSMTSAEANAHYAASQRRRFALPELVGLVRDDAAVRARLARTRDVGALYSALKPLASSPLLAPLVARLRPPARTKVKPPRAAAAAPGRISPVHPKQVDFLAAETVVRIEKARRLLGFEPAFDFARGIDMTERWARWANLIPDEASV
nr:hypothetical protein [Trueperaceae bacterium]